MSGTAWAAVAVFAAAYTLIATEKIHRVAAALGGAAIMLLIGATDAERSNTWPSGPPNAPKADPSASWCYWCSSPRSRPRSWTTSPPCF